MKKKHGEHVNLERWLVSYADFITLLFAFFVIMYAISQADLAKFKQLKEGIRKAFSAAGPVGVVDLGGNAGGNTATPLESGESSGGRVIDMPAGKVNTAGDPDPELQEARELMEESISLELGATEVNDKLNMQFDSRGLVVRIAAKDFFDEGQAEPRFDLRPILDRMGRVLSKTNRLIRIEGHTDLGEANLSGSEYSSDWELSAARATWLVKYWVQRFEFNPSKLGAAGYSHFRPLALGKDPLSKSKNRRVEIIVLNNRYEAP